MRKIGILFVLMMFIISAVPVYAPGTESGNTDSVKPMLISDESVSKEDAVNTCIQRYVNVGKTKEDARIKCTATAVATAVSTTDAFSVCIERKVDAGLTKDEARVKCGAQAVTQVRTKAQTCVEGKIEAGLTQEEARIKCAGQGLEKVGEILEKNLEECVNTITEKYPSMSEDNAKEKCKGLLRARIVNVANFARLHEQEIKKVELLERARAKTLEGLDEGEIREKLKQYKVTTVKKEDLFRQREITKEKLENAKEKYQTAKNKYEEVKEKAQDRKEEFLRAKERIGECEDPESEECEQKRAEATERAREYIISSAETAIEHLNKIREQVEGSDDIGEEEAAKIVEDIDNAITALEEAVDKAEAAETKEEVQEAARTVSRVWAKIKNRAKLHAARVVHAKVGEIVVRSKQLEAKLNRVLENMEEQGIEVKDIEAKVDKFSDKIEEARVLHKHSTDMFVEAKESANPGLVKQAKELSAQAHEALKEAHRILVDITKAIKAAGGSLDIEEDEEVEVIEEVEEEETEDELAEATTVEDYEDELEEEDEEETEEEDESDDDVCVEDTDCDEDEVCTDSECEDIDDDEEETDNLDDAEVGDDVQLSGVITKRENSMMVGCDYHIKTEYREYSTLIGVSDIENIDDYVGKDVTVYGKVPRAVALKCPKRLDVERIELNE